MIDYEPSSKKCSPQRKHWLCRHGNLPHWVFFPMSWLPIQLCYCLAQNFSVYASCQCRLTWQSCSLCAVRWHRLLSWYLGDFNYYACRLQPYIILAEIVDHIGPGAASYSDPDQWNMPLSRLGSPNNMSSDEVVAAFKCTKNQKDQ